MNSPSRPAPSHPATPDVQSIVAVSVAAVIVVLLSIAMSGCTSRAAALSQPALPQVTVAEVLQSAGWWLGRRGAAAVN